MINKKNSLNSFKGKGHSVFSQVSQSGLDFLLSPNPVSKRKIKIMRFLTENKEETKNNKNNLKTEEIEKYSNNEIPDRSTNNVQNNIFYKKRKNVSRPQLRNISEFNDNLEEKDKSIKKKKYKINTKCPKLVKNEMLENLFTTPKSLNKISIFKKGSHAKEPNNELKKENFPKMSVMTNNNPHSNTNISKNISRSKKRLKKTSVKKIDNSKLPKIVLNHTNIKSRSKKNFSIKKKKFPSISKENIIHTERSYKNISKSKLREKDKSSNIMKKSRRLNFKNILQYNFPKDLIHSEIDKNNNLKINSKIYQKVMIN